MASTIRGPCREGRAGSVRGFDPCTGDVLPGAEPPPPADATFRSWLSLEKPTVVRGKVVYIGTRHRVKYTEKDVNRAWPFYTTLGLFVATGNARGEPVGHFRGTAYDTGRPHDEGHPEPA